ncbi:MAG TPA: DUF362 domain-containing protein, partial [Clostridiaceae bacterium]
TVTHFTVFEAIVRIVKEYTNDIAFGDSPGYGDGLKAARRCGILEVAERYGVKYADFSETVHVVLDEALICKSWDVAKVAFDADVVITLPRLKTHALTYFTGAVKNQFGCIPGMSKKTWHARMPEVENFSKMLLDLNSVVKTSFSILEGIIAMEGNGPSNGTPHRMDTLIMGESITAVDSTAVRLIGYEDPTETPVLKVAKEHNYGPVMPSEIEVLGETIESMKATNFKLCRIAKFTTNVSPILTNLIKKLASPNPALTEEKCIGCGRCREVCPEEPKVITMVKKAAGNRPVWNLNKCIRCFCCQELCPEGAIVTRYTKLGKLLRLER